MKRHAILLLSATLFSLTAAPAPEEATHEGTLTLSDESILHGVPDTIDASGKLTWHSKALVEPMNIPCADIVEMRLKTATPPAVAAKPRATARLNNGDAINGELLQITDTHITLKPWYADSLQLRRTMVQDIEIMPDRELVYSGPQDFASWKIAGEQGAWQLDSGTLSSTKGASIARRMELPEKCLVRFKIHWPTSLRFRLLLFSDQGQTTQPDNCFDMVCQRRFIYLRKRWMDEDKGGSRILGQRNIPALAENNTAQFDLYCDRKAGSIVICVNGTQHSVMSDNQPDKGAFGNWLHFVSENFYPLEISNIRVFKWDGKLPVNDQDDEKEPERRDDQDVLRIQGRAGIACVLRGIEEGALLAHSDEGELRLPLAEVRTIEFKSSDYEEPVRKRGDIRAWTSEGERITFRLDSFGRKTLKGYSQNFGEADFDRRAFTRLEFNLYDERLDRLRVQGRN